jgi:hypothetical protein
MDRLIQEIRAALEANMFTLGLQGTLALIDIAAAVNSPNGQTDNKKFKAWFENNLPQYAGLLDADDVYQMRCGMVHQGQMRGSNYEAIVLTLPGGGVFHRNLMDNAIQLDLITFCTEVLDAVQAWWDAGKGTEPIKTNSENVVRIRMDGLPPYVEGPAVLA